MVDRPTCIIEAIWPAVTDFDSYKRLTSLTCFSSSLRYCILWDTITGMEIQQTDQFRKWLRRLRDRDAKARIIARIRQCGLAGRPVGDMHPVGNGVNELRFFFGPGYRVYFAQKGDRIMLLLAGGDKTGQDRAIKEAQEMLESLIKEGQW